MPIRGLAFLFVPPAIVLCIGLAILRRQTQSAADARPQNRLFLFYVAGGGCLVVVLMIIAVVILTAATRAAQATLWLIFAPWGFAIGEAIGLVLWKRRASRAAA
jgi:hypothetical protein